MKRPLVIFLLPGFFLLMSCNDSKHVAEILNRAEVLMTEHPDSAWTILNTISPDEMGENSIRARYALLYTQVKDELARIANDEKLSHLLQKK